MSREVSLQIVRKVDNVPWETFYLGGNGTVQAIPADLEKRQLATPAHDYIPLSAEEAGVYLINAIDSFYLGHAAEDAMVALQNEEISEFAIFIIIE